MKTLKISILIPAMLISFTLMAQQPTPQKEAMPTNTQKMSTKETWTKYYNDLNHKLNQYVAKVKEAGSDEEFRKELKNLDDMMADLKGKIDKLDKATQDERDKAEEVLNKNYQKIRDEYEKVKAEWEEKQSKEKQEPNPKN